MKRFLFSLNAALSWPSWIYFHVYSNNTCGYQKYKVVNFTDAETHIIMLLSTDFIKARPYIRPLCCAERPSYFTPDKIEISYNKLPHNKIQGYILLVIYYQ